jgi:anti-sigma B factor antagonist
VRVHTDMVPNGIIVAVDGELAAGTVGRLTNEIDRIASDGVRLVLDLTDLSFMDSAGLGAILYAWMTIARVNGHLALVCPVDSHLQRTLKLRGVADRLTVVASREEALALP